MPRRCGECYRWFSTHNELIMHEKSHLPEDIPCLGAACSRTFKTHGGMLIHMEYGSCPSGANRLGLEAAAARIYQWRQFIDPDDRDQLLDYEEPYSQPFKCPECGKWFGLLSGLLQHVESPACDCEVYDEDWVVPRLLRWLRKYYR